MSEIISENTITNNQVGMNLYKHDGRYYRLFATGKVNGWLINPYMMELIDIDVANGKDVYGLHRLDFDGITGTVGAYREYIRVS